MAHPINMPQVGQDIETAVITEWKVKVGDRIEKGDVVALVESDKAVFEVEAFQSGIVLELLFQEDEEACVLEPIAVIGEEGEDPRTISSTRRESGNVEEKESSNSEPEDELETGISSSKTKVSASPSARRLALELGVDLQDVAGSGPQGRITKADVQEAASAGKESAHDSPACSGDPGDRVIPFSRMRQSIADRLTRSAQTIPHFYLTMRADVTEFMAWREQYQDSTGNRISVNSLAVKAAASALERFPRMNAHVEADRMTLCREVNIGIAVSLEEGLIVPVIPDAPSLGLAEIAVKIREISESARRAVLSAGAPGTFTVSNLGMLGVAEFMPIINPPEAGIMGVGAVEPQVIIRPDGTPGVRELLPLTLGCDHRAVDGYYAGRFLQSVREEIEKIELWQNL